MTDYNNARIDSLFASAEIFMQHSDFNSAVLLIAIMMTYIV